jgi:U3 small nucleolar RNA-associated protein 20
LLVLVEKKIGSERFCAIRNIIERQINELRDKRREQRRILAVSNPEANAKRKIAKNLCKRRARKRKVEEFKKHKTRLSVKKSKVSSE